MLATIDTLQEYGVDFPQQRVDRIDNLNSHPLELRAVFRHTIMTGRNVRAAGRISRHDAHAGQLARGVGRVDNLGERRGVRGIATHNAKAQGLFGCVQFNAAV